MAQNHSSRTNTGYHMVPIDRNGRRSRNTLSNMPNVQQASPIATPSPPGQLPGGQSQQRRPVDNRGYEGARASYQEGPNYDHYANGFGAQGMPQRRHTEPYQMATLVHSMSGNSNSAPIEEGANFVQDYSAESSPTVPSFFPQIQIPLDALGRAHNVIGHVEGNANFATVAAGATVTQNYRPRRAPTADNPQLAPVREAEDRRFSLVNQPPSRSAPPFFPASESRQATLGHAPVDKYPKDRKR